MVRYSKDISDIVQQVEIIRKNAVNTLMSCNELNEDFSEMHFHDLKTSIKALNDRMFVLNKLMEKDVEDGL